ncbi:MAG: response regulator [Calditrichaeota bacterium]|nr:response regulator [Calditrichota bacterium]
MNEIRPNILIIDDDPDILATLDALLSSENYNVKTCSSGAEAEKLLQTYRFSTILIDIYLPDYDGLEFVTHIQEKGITRPVIVITGSSEIEKARKAIQIGVFDYLVKPIKNRQLLQVVRNAVMQNLLLEERANLEKQKRLYQEQLEKLVSEKVTELEESEFKYKNLVEQSLVGVFVIQNDRFQYLNKKAYEIFGVTPIEALNLKGLTDFLAEEARKAFDEKLTACLKGDQPNLQLTVKAKTPDGREPILNIWIARIQYKKKPALEGIVLDVTDQIELKNRQRLLEIQLMSAHKMAAIGNLAAGIAHNLNNPVSVIQANAELLKMLHPEMKEVDRILDQTKRMIQLINTIVMKGKREQSQQFEPIDLNKLILQEIEFLKANLFFKHKVKKEFNFKENLPKIKGRYSDFSQSINNLIDNAIDAMFESDERQLTITTDFNDQYIIFRISDTGSGIDKKVKDRIFEPFFTTKLTPTELSSPSELPCGSGLGLSMLKTLLEPYGVKIELESEKGKGTTFTLYIPYDRNQNFTDK